MLQKKGLCTFVSKEKAMQKGKKQKDEFWQGPLAQLDLGSGRSKSLNYIKIDFRKNQ